MHSLWGMIYMVAEKTGWSWDEILYKRSWINVRMMLADAPRLGKASKKRRKLKGLDELKR